MADEPKSPPQDEQASGAGEQPGPAAAGGGKPGAPPESQGAGESAKAPGEAGKEAAKPAGEADKPPVMPPKAAEETTTPATPPAKPAGEADKPPITPSKAAEETTTPATPPAKAAGEAAKPADTTPKATPAMAKPAAAAPAAKPAAPGAKPAAPAAKPAPKPVVKPEPWSSPLVDAIKQRFSGAVLESLIFRNQPWLTLAPEHLLAVCQFLRSAAGGGFDYLTDETAVDYPKREKRFEIIYILYSFSRNERLRLKVAAGENDAVASVAGVWPAANWLEREIYDMFGVKFAGHPDLKRILLPDGWTGYPLRKDYDILRQDKAWVQENLKIESGQ